MKPLISIIVPVYNAEEYLERCLDSIVNQTYQNLEIILINDGSTDNSLEICNRYKNMDSRIIVVNQENFGVSYTKNVGLKYATGDYIGFVDSDDVVSKNMYSILCDLILKTNMDIVSCGYVKFSDKCTFKIDNAYYIFDKIESIKKLLLEDNITNFLWDKLFKKDVFKNVNLRKGIIFEDMDIMYKLFDNANGIAICNSILYGYYQRSDSYTHCYSYEKMLNYIDVYQKRYNFLNNNYFGLKKEIDSSLIFSIFILFRMIVFNKDKKLLNDSVMLSEYRLLKKKRIINKYNIHVSKKILIKLLKYNRYLFYYSLLLLYKIKGEC